jgi:hypothetical protein
MPKHPEMMPRQARAWSGCQVAAHPCPSKSGRPRESLRIDLRPQATRDPLRRRSLIGPNLVVRTS